MAAENGVAVPHDVFISYASANKAVADGACHMLEAAGVRCWMAPRDVKPGTAWTGAIVEAIEGCRVMVVVVSRNSNDSPEVLREVQQAVGFGVAVLPFRIEDVPLSKSLKYLLGTQHWMDAMTPPMEEHLRRLSVAVHGLLGSSPPPGAGRVARRAPWKVAAAVAGAVVLSGSVILTIQNWTGRRAVHSGSRGEENRESAEGAGVRTVLDWAGSMDALLGNTQAVLDPAAMRAAMRPPTDDVPEPSKAAFVANAWEQLAKGQRSFVSGTPLMVDTKPMESALRACGASDGDVDRYVIAMKAARDQSDALLSLLDGFAREASNSRDMTAMGTTPPRAAEAMEAGVLAVHASRTLLEARVLAAHLAVVRGVPRGSEVATRLDASLRSLKFLTPTCVPTAQECEAATDHLIDIELLAQDRLTTATRANEAVAGGPLAMDADLMKRWDNFEPLPSDTRDRLIAKAQTARASGRVETGVRCFEYYGEQFGKADASEREYARVAVLFSRHPIVTGQGTAVYVAEVAPDSPASGLLLPGDVIVGFDGQQVHTAEDLIRLTRAAGDRSGVVRVLRPGPRELEWKTLRVAVPPTGRLQLTIAPI